MTLLAADIGNSDTVLGLLEGAEVVAHWRVSVSYTHLTLPTTPYV